MGPDPTPLTIAVTNLKGGTSKTTTAAYLAHVLHEQGQRVLLVDADPQRSALTWSELADWPFSVVGMPTSRMHRELPGIVGDRYGAVVIDTPPSDGSAAIVSSALRAASHVVVPCAPTPAEFERLRVLWPLLEEARDLAPVPPQVAVLLVRTVAGAASTAAYRQVMEADGWTVLRPTVGRLERFAQAFGDQITRASSTAYGDALEEMTTMHKEVPA